MKKFLANVIEKKANKFLVALLGGAVTAVTAKTGLPLADFATPEWVSATSAAITAALVYAIRNA